MLGLTTIQGPLGFVLGSISILITAIRPGHSVTDLPCLGPADPVCQDRADDIAADLGIESVDLLVWEHDVANAIPFGTRAGGILVVTSRLIELLDDEAFEAAVAHELGHVRAGHARRYAIVVTLVTVGAWVSGNQVPGSWGTVRRWVWRAIVVQFASLGLLAISRRYEREADRAALRVLEDPEALVRAILIVRTGDPDADVEAMESSRSVSGRIGSAFSFYPSLSERRTYLIDESDRDASR